MSKAILTPTKEKELKKIVASIKEQMKHHSFDELIGILKAHNVDQLTDKERQMDFNCGDFSFTIDEIKSDKVRLTLNSYVEVFDDNNGVYVGYATIK